VTYTEHLIRRWNPPPGWPANPPDDISIPPHGCPSAPPDWQFWVVEVAPATREANDMNLAGPIVAAAAGCVLAVSPLLSWARIVLIGDLNAFQLLQLGNESTTPAWIVVLVGLAAAILSLTTRRRVGGQVAVLLIGLIAAALFVAFAVYWFDQLTGLGYVVTSGPGPVVAVVGSLGIVIGGVVGVLTSRRLTRPATTRTRTIGTGVGVQAASGMSAGPSGQRQTQPAGMAATVVPTERPIPTTPATVESTSVEQLSVPTETEATATRRVEEGRHSTGKGNRRKLVWTAAVIAAVIALTTIGVWQMRRQHNGIPAGMTRINFNVQGCEGCQIVPSMRGKTVIGTVKDGKASVLVPTKQTFSMYFAISPVDLEWGAQPVIVLNHDGATGGAAPSPGENAYVCWAGTTLSTVSINVVAHETASADPNGKAGHWVAAYATPTLATTRDMTTVDSAGGSAEQGPICLPRLQQ
jgi:hypothetical protein